MEASALQAPVGIARRRLSIGAPLLRLRSDEQLVALFRAGHEEAFRVIHERYRPRLFAYTRQMLRGSSQDAEDAIQDIFVRAYSGLRSDRREVALRAWLYRVAHNRCIDELRRPTPPAPELLEQICSPIHDPTVEAEQRESLRRLLIDVQRLPEQQRSALLMRELGGMPYADLAAALDVSVPALKSLLVRARVSLAQSLEARNIECSQIREQLISAHDQGVQPGGLVRRHMRDCDCCRNFRTELRGMSSHFAALIPALGPMAVLAKALGFGSVSGGAGSSTAAGSGAAGSGAVSAGGAVGTGGAAASLGAIGAGHVATLLAAAVVTAAGAVEIQQTIVPTSHAAASHQVQATSAATAPSSGVTGTPSAAQIQGATDGVSEPPQGSGQGANTPAAVKSVAQQQPQSATSPQVATGTQTAPPTVTSSTTGNSNPSSGTTDSSPPPSTSGTSTGTTTTSTGIGLPPTSGPTGLLGGGSSSSGPPSGTTTLPTGTTLPPSTGSSGTPTIPTTPAGTSSDPGSSPPSFGSTKGGSGGGS